MIVLETLPRLTALTFVQQWTLDPFALTLVLVAGGLYGLGLARLHQAGERWSPGRSVTFAGGLLIIVIATMSGLAVYSAVLFTPATIANLMLDLMAPLALAVGDPIGLAGRVLAPGEQRRLAGVLSSRAVRFCTYPLVSSAAVLVSELSIYFTPYFRTALTQPAIWQLMHLQLLGTGLLFVLPMVTDHQLLPSWCGHGLRVLLVFLDGLFDSLPGLLIMLSPVLLAGGWYAAQPRNWGPSVRLDQQVAGGALFSLAELVALPFLVAVFVAWWRHERVSTAELDARLDEEWAAAGETDDGRVRPWWTG